MYFPGMSIFGDFDSKLSSFVEKLDKNELTLEDILNEEEIIKDIKNNNDSKFLKFFTNKTIQKLIDYSTKMPESNEHNIGYKYPFNSTEILCSENINFQNKLMSEKPLGQTEEEINVVNKIKNRGDFLFKLFEAINNTDKREGIGNDEENGDDEDDSEDFDEDQPQIIHNNNNNQNNKIIYENVDYLLGFLKESNETKENYVLAGYFYKILTTLINVHSNKIVQYLYDYPKKDEFDVLGLLVKNMNRKSMCNIIQKLLLFDDDLVQNLDDQKINLLEVILQELNDTNEKQKYECICDSLASIMVNKQFFDLFMKKANLLEMLYNILINSKNNKKKCSLLQLLTKINDNILQHFQSKCTPNLYENNDLMPLNFDTCNSNNKSLSCPDENNNSENLKNYLLNYFDILEKSKFLFLDDLGNYSQEENAEFISTYLETQKKIGIKKIVQAEYIRTLFDIFVNSYFAGFHKGKIEELINIANNQNIFWNLHNLFFSFPFSNIYQIYYNQIIEIILNQNSPNCLIDFFISDNIENKNLINIYIDIIINNIKFIFKLTNTKSLNPIFPYCITLLNKIFNSQNLHLKEIIEKNKDLTAFNEIMGKEVQEIFDQKLLLSSQGINFGELEEELTSFGPKNFLELLEEDLNIYASYKNGNDYNLLLKEKKERIEKEKQEKEKGKEKEKKDTKKVQYLEDLDEVEEEEDPLFKVQKISLENEKGNFLSLLNRPIEEVYKDIDDKKIDIGIDKDKDKDKDKDEDNKDKKNRRIDIKDLEDDIEEKENTNMDENEKEKINKENNAINEDISPNNVDNQIYYIEYHRKTVDDNKEAKEN